MKTHSKVFPACLPDLTTSCWYSSAFSSLISLASNPLDATERYEASERTSDLTGVVGVGAARAALVLEVGVDGATGRAIAAWTLGQRS